MTGTIGSLGDVVFECSSERVKTFDQVSKKTTAVFARHEVIGKKPLLEHTGFGLASFDFVIKFNISLGMDPAASMDELGALLGNAEPLGFITGGKYHGDYVLESVDEKWLFMDGNGRLLVAEAKIKITEFVAP